MKSKAIRKIRQACLLMATALGACAGFDEGEPLDGNHSQGEVVSRSDALWAPTWAKLLPNGKVTVCFWPVVETTPPDSSERTWKDGDHNNADYVAMKALIRSTVESTYESSPEIGIDFTGWGTCSDGIVGSAIGLLRVTVEIGDANGAGFRHCSVGDKYPQIGCSHNVGYTSTQEMNIHLATQAYAAAHEPLVIRHEFGHALGFGHEYRREDSDDCRGSGNNSLGEFITEYDHDSVMNGTYCHWSTTDLSKLDRLGLAFAYPRGDVKVDLAAAHAMQFGGGWAVRSSAPFIITNDYISRGIKAGSLGSVEWYLDGGLTWNTQETAIANFGILRKDQNYLLAHSFRDPWERDRGALISLVASDAKRAAVIGAALN